MGRPRWPHTAPAAIALGLAACACFGTLGQPEIPPNAKAGLEPRSVRFIGHLRLADWAARVSPSLYASIFEGTLSGTGAREKRVFLHDGEYSRYLGPLSDQLQLPGVRTLFLDLGVETCIIGWVSPATRGKELYFRVERPETNRKRWMDAYLESTIERGVFIVPIPLEKRPDLWRRIEKAAVQTQESLHRGAEGQGSFYEIERSFSPPMDVWGALRSCAASEAVVRTLRSSRTPTGQVLLWPQRKPQVIGEGS